MDNINYDWLQRVYDGRRKHLRIGVIWWLASCIFLIGAVRFFRQFANAELPTVVCGETIYENVSAYTFAGGAATITLESGETVLDVGRNCLATGDYAAQGMYVVGFLITVILSVVFLFPAYSDFYAAWVHHVQAIEYEKEKGLR